MTSPPTHPSHILSPTRIGIAAVPIVAFLITPLLPFVNGPHRWFGIPSVLWWMAFWTVGVVVSLRLVEHHYQRDGGAEIDAAEQAVANDEPTEEVTR